MKYVHMATVVLLLSMAAFFGVGTYETLKIVPNLNDAIQNLNRATYAIGSETATEERDLQAQTKDVHVLIVRAGATMDEATFDLKSLQFVVNNLSQASSSLNDLVKHTDVSVNGQVLPQLTATLKDASAAVNQTNARLLELQEPIRNLTVASAAVTLATPPILKNVSITSSNVAATSVSMAASASDAKKVADHWEKVLMSPTTPIKAALGYIGHWTAVFLGSAL